MADNGRLDLRAAHAFMFDIDGTLLHRGPDGRGHPQPGAVDVLQRIRASGRKLVLFTNGSHVPSPTIAEGLRNDGLHVSDDEVLTPVDSATAWGASLARGATYVRSLDLPGGSSMIGPGMRSGSCAHSRVESQNRVATINAAATIAVARGFLIH